MSTLPRRAVARGIAWSAPSLVLARATPALATSALCPGCPDAGFGTGLNQNGWQWSSTGVFAAGGNQRMGIVKRYAPWPGIDTCTRVRGGIRPALDDVLLVEADPRAAAPCPKVTYRVELCLTAGTVYTFSYDWSSYNGNSRGIISQARLLDGSGALVALIGDQVAALGKTVNGSGSRSGTFTPSVTGTYTFEYHFSWDTGPASYDDVCRGGTNGAYANDIAVTAPRISCA
jgi:hypothetical protein